MRYKLKENHPAMIAFNKLCQYADDLGVKIEFVDNHVLYHYENMVYELVDIEPNHAIDEFPPVMEFHITFEKD